MVNFKVCGVLPLGLSYQQKGSSLRMLNTMCGKTLSFISYAEIEFIEDACLKKRFIVSYTTAMPQPVVVTLDQTKPLQRYSKQVSIGPHSLRTQGNLS